MRSIYTKIVVWGSAALLFSALAAFFLSVYVSTRLGSTINPALGINEFLEADALHAYKADGPAGLADFYTRAKKLAGVSCMLVDDRGNDLATGKAEARRPGGTGYYKHTTSDGAFRFLASAPPPPLPGPALVLHFLFTLVLICALCWLLAFDIATPLRLLADKVERFGRGELDQRLELRRRDEIGDLSRSFNEMAERIGTLLTSERRLLQDVSHELRSPLARLAFAAQLMRTAQDREAAYERLKREIDRLTELVTALVEVNRLEGDPKASGRETVDLRELVEELTESCSIEAEPRGCTINVEADCSPFVLGDRELLRRAVENVLRNAIRFAPGFTVVEVRLRQESELVTLTIRDYGPGVPEFALTRLFDPFFRVDESRDSATGGVGLGLSIADRVVRLHGGVLQADNMHPGLKVYFSLPQTPLNAVAPNLTKLISAGD